MLLQQLYEVRTPDGAYHKLVADFRSEGDFVQDLYLRELKNYKPPLVKASDSEGHVQTFSPPKAPQSPEESDIANDLKEYETQQVELEGQASGEEGAATEVDWFEEAFADEEEDDD